MKRHIAALVIAASALVPVACHHAPAAAPAVAPVKGGEPGIPKTTWPPIFFHEFDAVTASARLTPLRAEALGQGEREVRIWIGGGIGYPQQLYRFTERDGRVRGTLIRYWPAGADGDPPGETFDDLIRYYQRGRCTNFRKAGSMSTCEALFTTTPDWRGVLRTAERQGVWTLEDPSTLPRDRIMVLDGWGITVELRDGSAYRAYQYDNPGSHPSWPRGPQAIAIANAMRGVDSLARTEGEWFRGITSGRWQGGFTDCATGAAWEFRGTLGDYWKTHPGERARIGEAADSLYEVRLRAVLSPEWLARRWNSKYKQILQVEQVTSVRKAPVRGCS